MAKDKGPGDAPAGGDTAAGVASTATAAVPEDRKVRLYLKSSWTTGNGTTYPPHADGQPPLEFDFDNLPEGVTAGGIDFLIQNGHAESAAMREAQAKVKKA